MKAAATTSAVSPWRTPPEKLVLGCDEVHVWRATLDQAPSQTQRLLDTLAADEQARAARFHFARDREHFIVARGVLRTILGRYLDQPPECLSFRYGSHGKPALVGHSGGNEMRFNVSHSYGVALYAITRGRELGIDLERIRSDLAVAEIAERFFSRREVAMLRSLPVGLQHQAFFRCWTGKEAYIKARGEGLSLPLDQFDVSFPAGEAGPVLSSERDPTETSRWSVRELGVGSGYAAALVVEGHSWRLACWHWPDRRPG